MLGISASMSSSASSGPVQFGNVKSGDQGTPPWAMVAIAVAALALIGGAVFLFLKKSK